MTKATPEQIAAVRAALGSKYFFAGRAEIETILNAAFAGAPAQPVAHLVWLQGRIAADDVVDCYEVARPGDKSVDGSEPFPVYSIPPTSTQPGAWLPIEKADREITHQQSFPEIGLTIRNSDRYWVRDADGRVFEASWTEDGKGRDYWWDWEGESPVDPVEFMPHPLDPRFSSILAASPAPPAGGEVEQPPMKLEISREWFEKRAALEGDSEIGAGRRLAKTIDLTPEEIIELERLLPRQAEIEDLRAQITTLAADKAALEEENERLRAAVTEQAKMMLNQFGACREQLARADAAEARLQVVEAVLEWISYHYDNQDMNHVDFRVEAAFKARAALQEPKP